MKPKELTLRGLILGALITTVFTAANVYLGLKVGLTFASSIPAAVISMAILSAVKDSSILENNIVQTVASAAGTLSAIIFVLPGLVIVGWWTGFPFWQSFLICVSGGVLGVLFTIPLRRALVTNSDLPYPEGVAAAEVLKVGSGTRGETKDDTGEAREGLVAVILGSVASAGLAILTATRIAAGGGDRLLPPRRDGVERLQRRVVARAARRRTSRRPVGRHGDARRADHRVGDRGADPDVDAARGRGRDARRAHDDDLAHAGAVHRRRRDRGRGDLHAGDAREAGGRRTREHARRVAGARRPATIATAISRRSGSIVLTAVCLVDRRRGSRSRSRKSTVLAPSALKLTLIAVPFVLLVGFLIAGICGYMAGLIGASNSPISGVGILSIVICASVLVARRAADGRRRGRRWSRSRCSSRRSCSPARRSRTTTCRI